MSKLTLTNLDNLQNEATAVAAINANSALIETALEGTLSRDGTTPNTMASDLDMDSNDLLNVGNIAATDITLNGTSIATQVTDAAASAAAALVSETNAASSASSATASAATATTQASTATTQAGIATTQATNSAASAVLAQAAATSYPGFKYTWSTDTTASDPGTGTIKINNATYASATALYISETDANGNSIAPIVGTWDDSTSTRKTIVHVVKDGTHFLDVAITGTITDNGTWDTFSFTYDASNSTFANGDTVFVYYSLVGDAGSGSLSGMSAHGVPIAGSSSAITSSIALTDGQLIVGQTGADPLAKTVSGDITLAASGAASIGSTKVTSAMLNSDVFSTAHSWSGGQTFTAPSLGAATATSINKVAITAPATSSTITVADGKTLTASNTLTLAGTDSTTMTFPAISTNVGFREIPQNSQSAAYTTVLTDNGKHILHPSTDANARTFTIDSNANVAYPIGTCITFVNQTSQVVTIAITSDTMTLANTTTTGSRSLAQNGVATALKVGTTNWIISGTGLT